MECKLYKGRDLIILFTAVLPGALKVPVICQVLNKHLLLNKGMDGWIGGRILLLSVPLDTSTDGLPDGDSRWELQVAHKGTSSSLSLSPCHLPCPTQHTSCYGDPPALIVVSQSHSIALLGGHNPDSAHAVLALHIGVVARVTSSQLGIELVVHTGWGKGISDAVPAERLVLPDHDGCRGGRGQLVGAGKGHRLEEDHHVVRV